MKINLERELSQLCFRNRDGSYATQYNRLKILTKAARDLKNLGYFNLSHRGLKPKHVDSLIKFWQDNGLSPGTLKNRMAHLRWWAEKIAKPNIIARDNTYYGIARRQYVTNQSKAVQIDNQQLDSIKDPYIKCSIELQRAFGLRREECLKFQPTYADRGDKITLKASWTKGGRPRDITITNEYQRKVLDRAHKIAGSGSMIPKILSYRQQLNKYTGAVFSAGLSNLHGLRHEYAQERYRVLTGWNCPAKGGPTSKKLTPKQKQIDYKARIKISKELGHDREQITAVYLGR